MKTKTKTTTSKRGSQAKAREAQSVRCGQALRALVDRVYGPNGAAMRREAIEHAATGLMFQISLGEYDGLRYPPELNKLLLQLGAAATVFQDVARLDRERRAKLMNAGKKRLGFTTRD